MAKGKTNRAIADELIVSEKTVASHLSHIFTKLDLTSRAAATAFAYENDLVKRQALLIRRGERPRAAGPLRSRLRRAAGQGGVDSR